MFIPPNLYYLISFATFVLMCKMFISPNLIVGALCGICAGLAYLTKVSMLPAVGIFAVVFSIQELYLYLAPNRSGNRCVHYFVHACTGSRVWGSCYYYLSL